MATRKRDGAERRRELCDAAIEVLALHGSRGLSHQRVDRHAGLPDGTTSYYFRTRAALVQAVGMRVADIDTENLRSITAAGTRSNSPFGRLAQLVMLQADGRGLMLNRARQELALSATRDSELSSTATEFVIRVNTMTQEAIAEVNPSSGDPASVAAAANAVLTFISGVLTRFALGDRAVTDSAELERLLHAIATAAYVAHVAEQPAEVEHGRRLHGA
ncbi:MAG: TetR family transcriptional regulator [Mycobacterium sp.]